MNKYRLIKFEKDNCKPCKDLGTYLDSKEIEYTSINAFNFPEEAMKYKIMSVPVLILLNSEGNVIEKQSGFSPEKVNYIIDKFRNMNGK